MRAVCTELKSRRIAHDLMGFTTAYAVFDRAGLDPLDVSALLSEDERDCYVRKLADMIPLSGHPDISQEQTEAYFAAGFCDLCERHGNERAMEEVASLGRKAFEPVTVFERYFRLNRPSVIVATTSPRFELAAIKAGRKLNIPTLAIGDVFRVTEQEWMKGDFADHMTVVAPQVAGMLTEAGLSNVTLHALGNPAFDALRPRPTDGRTRSKLRHSLGIDGKKVILWPLGGSDEPVSGRRLLTADQVRIAFDRFCAENPGYRYLMRPHPNWPVPPIESEFGILDSKMTAEEALLVSDVVCVESSTLGLQAALKGIPVICLGFAEYVVYPQLGWAQVANSLDELLQQLADGAYFQAPEGARALVGSSSGAVVDLIERVAQTNAQR